MLRDNVPGLDEGRVQKLHHQHSWATPPAIPWAQLHRSLGQLHPPFRLPNGEVYIRFTFRLHQLLFTKRQGAVTEVDLICVTVQNMGGTETKVKMEESQNTVKWLKLAIQDDQGISTFTQQLFLVPKGDNNTAGARGGAGAKQEPLKDDALVSDSSIVALCVDFSAALNEWDSSSPLISVSIAFSF